MLHTKIVLKIVHNRLIVLHWMIMVQKMISWKIFKKMKKRLDLWMMMMSTRFIKRMVKQIMMIWMRFKFWMMDIREQMVSIMMEMSLRKMIPSKQLMIGMTLMMKKEKMKISIMMMNLTTMRYQRCQRQINQNKMRWSKLLQQ